MQILLLSQTIAGCNATHNTIVWQHLILDRNYSRLNMPERAEILQIPDGESVSEDEWIVSTHRKAVESGGDNDDDDSFAGERKKEDQLIPTESRDTKAKENKKDNEAPKKIKNKIRSSRRSSKISKKHPVVPPAGIQVETGTIASELTDPPKKRSSTRGSSIRKETPKKHTPEKHPPKKTKSIPKITDDDAWEVDSSSSTDSIEKPPHKPRSQRRRKQIQKPGNIDDARWEELKEQFLDFSNWRLLPEKSVQKSKVVESFKDFRRLKRLQFQVNGLCGDNKSASKKEMDSLFQDVHGPPATTEEIEAVFEDFYERKVRLEITPDGVYFGVHLNPKFLKPDTESTTNNKKDSDKPKKPKSKKKPIDNDDSSKSKKKLDVDSKKPKKPKSKKKLKSSKKLVPDMDNKKPKPKSKKALKNEEQADDILDSS